MTVHASIRGRSGRSAIGYYSSRAGPLARKFQSISFEEVHSDLLVRLPPSGSNILDVGAGAGRDAAALARLGFAVTAVEPSNVMRRAAQIAHADARIHWVNDRLPLLSKLRARRERFALVLCSAVLMHISPAELEQAVRALAELVMEDGVVEVSVRDENESDQRGLFHTHTSDSIIAAGGKAGLAVLSSERCDDALGRSEIVWRSLRFRRNYSGADRNGAD